MTIYQRTIFKPGIFNTSNFSYLQTVRERYVLVRKNVTGDNSFSTYAEFSEKLLFLTP